MLNAGCNFHLKSTLQHNIILIISIKKWNHIERHQSEERAFWEEALRASDRGDALGSQEIAGEALGDEEEEETDDHVDRLVS